MEAFETIRVQLECIRDSIGETPVKYRHAAVVALKELAALEARLAVLGKVEEMPAKGVELLIRPAKDFGGGVIVEVRDAKFHAELYSRYGDTIEKALAALVDVKEGG